MYIKKQNNKLEISDFGDEHALIKKINLFLDGQIIDSKIYLEFSLESIKKIKTYFLKYNLLYSADKDTSQILDSIKKFEDIAISTKTVIGISNLKIDLEKFFNYIPITEFIPQEKKRGRKKRIQIVLNHNNLPNHFFCGLSFSYHSPVWCRLS
jgi:hypothetical protein